jgi:hypothetical protein
MIVKVTNHDIIQGKRMDCNACPVAIAMHRALGDAFDVQVLSQEEICIRDSRNATIAVFEPDPNLHMFIGKYDDGYPVYPIRFVFDESIIPPSYRDLLPRKQGWFRKRMLAFKELLGNILART